MNAPVEALPLYGLETLGDARQVIVVGDDECRDALASATGRTVVSWAGGTQGVKHTDWSPLAGRNVVIWPDADGSTDEIATILTGSKCTVRVMAAADGAVIPNAADAIRDGWDKARLDGFMRDAVRPWSPSKPPAPEKPPAPAGPIVSAAVPNAPVRDRFTAEPIYVIKGDIHEAVDRAMAVLSNASLGIYARGDDLVRAVTYSMPARTLTVAKQGENVDRPDGAVIIATLPDVALVETLTRHARFVKWDGRANKFVPCDCPAEVARMILANKGHGWTVPRLRAVISAPTLRPDGTVLSASGYDAATGLLLVGDRIWRQVPDSPSKRDALDALDALVEPIDAFPFVDNADRAAALALCITSVMRPSLRTVPMFAISAPAAGTGKSLLVDIAAIMATGRKSAVVTPTQDEAELEKRIGAAALAGDQIISIDNVTHILRSDQLCQMLTQDEVQVRVLGASKNVRIPSTALICATGNNLSIHGDLNRRAIRIRLDAKCERPDERRFDRDPTSLALRKRAELVAAALTIVRAYLSAGAPSQASPMGSFEDWSDTVRSALIWLGMGDCRGDVDAMRADDPEKAELAEIIDALPTGRFTVREIAHSVSESPEMREVFAGFIGRNGVFATKSFGRYLARFRGTIIGGRSIELAAKDIHGAVWQVRGEAAQEW
jgi:putative DNA primase/helicase